MKRDRAPDGCWCVFWICKWQTRTPTVSLTCCVPQRPEQSVRSEPLGPPQGRQGDGNKIQRNILQLSVILLHKSCGSGSAGRCLFGSSIMWLFRPDRSRFTITEVMFSFLEASLSTDCSECCVQREKLFSSLQPGLGSGSFSFTWAASWTHPVKPNSFMLTHRVSKQCSVCITCFNFSQVIRLNVFPVLLQLTDIRWVTRAVFCSYSSDSARGVDFVWTDLRCRTRTQMSFLCAAVICSDICDKHDLQSYLPATPLSHLTDCRLFLPQPKTRIHTHTFCLWLVKITRSVSESLSDNVWAEGNAKNLD